MIYEEKIFLALRHGGVLITGWQPGEDVVLAAARSPRGRAKHVCNLAAWHDTASSECYSPETGPELLSSPVIASWQARLHQVAWLGTGWMCHWWRTQEGKRGDVGQLTEVKSSITRAFCWGPSSGVSRKWVSVLGEGRIVWGKRVSAVQGNRCGCWSIMGNGVPGWNDLPFAERRHSFVRRSRSDGLRPKAEMIIGICALIGVSAFFMLCSARAHVIKTNVITSIIGWQ